MLYAGPPVIVRAAMTQAVEVREGSTANLTCDAIGFPMPNISWVRVNGGLLPPPYNRFAVKVCKYCQFVGMKLTSSA